MENYENFIRNTQLNNISKGQITVINAGVWDKHEYLSFECNPVNSGGSRVGTGFGKRWVECFSLDWIFKQHNITKCKFLKIDVEGSEYKIFETFTQHKKVKFLSMELHTQFGHEESFYSPETLAIILADIYGDRLKLIKYEGN